MAQLSLWLLIMRLLFLVPSQGGHHLEYIEHLSLLADECASDTFLFCLHPGFRGLSSIESITQKNNCEVIYLSEIDVSISKNRIISSFQLCKLLKKQIKAHQITDVFLIMLMPFGPLIFLPIWGNVRISGIIYSLYLYTWKSESIFAKIYNVIRFSLMSLSKNLEFVFVLNDEGCVRKLNAIYKTSKFKFLVDPCRLISRISSKYKIRENYPGKVVISHLGFMKERKGSYDILRAIISMNKSLLDNFLFVFAGNSEDPIVFNNLLNKAKEKADIFYVDGFLDFSELGELTSSSDLLLLPYHNTNQSSGIIGYGAQFNVSVVVPNENLLGKLVKRYNLGYTMPGNTVTDIRNFLETHNSFKHRRSNYITTNNVNNFIRTLINSYYGVF